jgi:hypothetical protein
VNLRRLTRARGFAAATALFAIGLFVLLGIVAASTARTNAKAKLFQELKDQIGAQSDLISNSLVLCRTIYPAADNGNGLVDGNGQRIRQQYPATPSDGMVASIVCPGQSPALLFTGDSRSLAPRVLGGFTPWSYVNDATSLRISITATNPGIQYYQDLLAAVARRIGSQAVASGDTLTVTLVN